MWFFDGWKATDGVAPPIMETTKAVNSLFIFVCGFCAWRCYICNDIVYIHGLIDGVMFVGLRFPDSSQFKIFVGNGSSCFLRVPLALFFIKMFDRWIHSTKIFQSNESINQSFWIHLIRSSRINRRPCSVFVRLETGWRSRRARWIQQTPTLSSRAR